MELPGDANGPGRRHRPASVGAQALALISGGPKGMRRHIGAAWAKRRIAAPDQGRELVRQQLPAGRSAAVGQ